MKLSTKMAIFINLFLVVTISTLFILNARHKQQMTFEAEIDKARKIILMTEGVREYSGSLFHSGAYHLEKLKEDADRFVEIVPVVTAMRVAASKAKQTGMNFKVPKISPRNPNNMPDHVDLVALAYLEAADTQTGETPEHIIFDYDNDIIRYYKAVRLTKECEMCHGDPADSIVHWNNSLGLDPTGVKMENWRAGEIHGAFEFMIPISPINGEVRAKLIADIISVIVILTILGFAAVYGTNKFIFNKLCIVKNKLGDIADGNGDLTQGIEYNKKDEIGDIVGSFNRFLDYIKVMVTDIQAQAEFMTSASSNLNENVETITKGVYNQKEDSESLSSAVYQIEANIASIVVNSRQTFSKTEQTNNTAAKGGEAVTDMIKKMKDLTETIHESSRMVDDLKTSTDRIGDIIAVINDIADQTNLLALNASIEAARAGEHGRGFAVVADEVRKLAERTQSATKEISEMILAVQKESQNAAMNIVNSVTKVEEGSRVAEVAGESLKAIIKDSRESSSMVEEILVATAEQESAISIMSENSTKINQVADETFLNLQKIADAANNLNNRAEELSSRVKAFKTQ